MTNEKPEYKLTWEEIIPFYNLKNYGKRNHIACLKGDERSNFFSKERFPRTSLLAFYDSTIVAVIIKGIESLVN